MSQQGQQRVIIENIQPQVDGGLYPVKRTVGELVVVSAHIFTDGHDHIRAEVLYKSPTHKEWQLLPLQHAVNDEWHASFPVSQQGYY